MISPRVLRPNSDYHLAVTLLEVSQTTYVTVEIGGKQDSGGFFKTTEAITVEPFASKILQLKVNVIKINII